jgi:hypothetical protein
MNSFFTPIDTSSWSSKLPKLTGAAIIAAPNNSRLIPQPQKKERLRLGYAPIWYLGSEHLQKRKWYPEIIWFLIVLIRTEDSKLKAMFVDSSNIDIGDFLSHSGAPVIIHWSWMTIKNKYLKQPDGDLNKPLKYVIVLLLSQHYPY